MLSVPFRRPRQRLLIVAAISACVVALISIVARRQQAAAGLTRSAAAYSAVRSDRGLSPAASTVTVNSLSDVANGADGLCTLREAITAANSDAASGATPGECAAGSGTDTIDMTTLNGTIVLTAELPNITSSVTLAGPGQSQLTISGNNSVRVFWVRLDVAGPVNFT